MKPLARRRTLAAIASAVTIVALLAGCTNDAAATKDGGTLEILTAEPAIHLDPASSQNLTTGRLGYVLRRLTAWRIDPGKPAEVVPDLATDTGTPSDGGKTWTYTLKGGVRFQDGSAITSRDVKWGVERSYAPTLTGGLSYHKALLVGGSSYRGPFDGKTLDSITTPDDRTIVFHLTAPYGDWPWLVSMPAFAPVPVGDGRDTAAYDESPVASGPYKVQSNRQGTELVLVRNSAWRRSTDDVRTAGPAKIVFRESQNPATLTRHLIADSGSAKNAFSATYLGAAELNQVRNDPSARERLVTSDPGRLTYLAINTQRGSLRTLEVRQALEYAVDKSAVLLAAGGQVAGTTASTLITPGIAGRKSFDLYPTGPTGDVDRARRLLAASGATDLRLTLITQNTSIYLAQAQAVQAGLARAGIRVTLKPLDPSSFNQTATHGNDYDLALYGWQPDFPSANANIQPLYESTEIGDGGYNLSKYRSAEVDALIQQATSTVDAQRAQSLWARADRRIMEDAPVVPLTFAKHSFLRGSNVTDFAIAGFTAYPNFLTVTLRK